MARTKQTARRSKDSKNNVPADGNGDDEKHPQDTPNDDDSGSSSYYSDASSSSSSSSVSSSSSSPSPMSPEVDNEANSTDHPQGVKRARESMNDADADAPAVKRARTMRVSSNTLLNNALAHHMDKIISIVAERYVITNAQERAIEDLLADARFDLFQAILGVLGVVDDVLFVKH